MKNLVLVFGLLFCVHAFSQEQYVYKGNGRVFDSKGVEVSPAQIRNLLSENTKALELYNAGRSKKTFGNIMLYGGMGLGIGWFA